MQDNLPVTQDTLVDTPIDAVILKSEKFPLSEALKLRMENRLTFQEIADRYGVTRQAVHGKLKRFIRAIGEPDMNYAYNNHRAGILNGVERVLVENILDPKRLKDASLNNLGYVFDKITHARRLEQDESTHNISIHAVVAAIKAQEGNE